MTSISVAVSQVKQTLWLKMAEGSVHTSSFKKFLKTVGIESNSGDARSSMLPGREAKSASTFYAHCNECLTECEVPSKSGWLFKQSRGVLRSWQEKWFVLNGNYLTQYSSDDETLSPQSLLFLKNHTVKEIAEPDTCSDDIQKFLFVISPSVDGSNLSLKSREETFTLAAKSPDERRAWVQLLRQVLYRDAGGGIFGQHLEDTLKYEQEREPDRQVPEIVQMCVEFLYTNGLEIRGLFRLPGRFSVVQKLREAFDVGGSRPSLDDVDVHSVASLLKSYLCDLPQPVIPVAHYDSVMHIVTRERPLDPEAAISAMSDSIQQLPRANYNLLHYLCEFLHNVACCSDINQMTASNLATVFSPCFIKPEIDDPALLAGTAINRATAVQDMIEHFSRIFPANVDSGCDSRNCNDPVIVDVTADQDGHSSLNVCVTQMPPDILMDARRSVVNVGDSRDENDLIEFQSSVVNDEEVNTSDSSVPQPSTSVGNKPATEVDHELHLQILMLQQQLHAERCSVQELRQQLVAERMEAARQAELLAKKLDEERIATASAVERVVELQTKLQQYSVKFGPLD